MGNFNITVDTDQMAHSIDGVSSHVNAVTAAVVGMQAAVLTAETAAANRICKQVDQGFFALVRSQITQKIAARQSVVDSRLLEMRQQGQALAAIKGRMERDYQMIAARYVRLFHSIDHSLRSRVLELDKAVSQLVNRELERIRIRLVSLQAQVPIHQLETVHSTQVVSVSQTKANAYRAIRAMHSFLSDSSRQAALLESILFDAAPGSGLCYVPLLVLETDGASASASQWEVRVAPGSADPASEKINAGAENAAFSAFPSLKWSPSANEARARIAAEYRRMLGKSALDPRIQAHMAALFDASSWQALPGGQT